MAYSTDHLFDQYTKLRLNGMNQTEAAQALQSYLQESSAEQRRELAQLMRSWENARTAETLSERDREFLDAAKAIVEDSNAIICSNCGHRNLVDVETCRVCNYPIGVKGSQTDLLAIQTGALENKTPFADDDTLLLMPKRGGDAISLKPQLFKRALTIGRVSELPEDEADITLTREQARKFGVSRFHAAIQYDENAKMVHVKDLGSTNGTFVNGRALVPNENHYLHDGDTLRLGGMAFSVTFTSLLAQ